MNAEDLKHMPKNKDTSITEANMVAQIVDEQYVRLGKKTTICFLTLQNGFEIVGTSACVDPANFDEEKGRYWARKEAFNKIWPLEGYALAKKMAEK